MNRRFLYADDGLEVRSDGDASVLSGYAAVFYREQNPGTEFALGPNVVERIAPGAFDEVLEGADTRALFNHDKNFVLGRYPKTLRMFVDEVGLRYEIDLPATNFARDLAESMRRGDINGSSFAFKVPDDGEQWARVDGTDVRTITKVSYLHDIGPVTFPAYKATEAMAREESWQLRHEEFVKECSNWKHDVELIKMQTELEIE